ncbi:MAG: hypothetical protein DELT_03142 [Desulfovibrio sp.]
MGHAVLRQYGEAVARDKRRDSVVDFRVHMVWPPCKHNTRISGLLEPFDRFLALLPHILFKSVKSGVRSFCGLLGLLLRNSVFTKFLHDLLGHELRFIKRHEEINKLNPLFMENVHIVFDNLRIRGHDRAIIVVVRIVEFLALERNARIKYPFYTFFGQVLDMPVNQLCRIANSV